MKTILLTNTYKGTPCEIIKSEVPEGFELLMLEETTQACLQKAVPQADYILASGRLKINRELLEAAKNLKMIQRTGVGLDSLDMDAIKEKGIPLYVNPGINSESVAEHTLLLMLACLRSLTRIASNTKQGIWNKQEQGTRTHELRGQTVGIIGMGNIAKRVVELLKPFGVKILYSNVFREPEEYEKAHVMRFVEMNELFSG